MPDVIAATPLEELTQFLYLTPVGVIRFGPDGGIEMINPMGVQLLLPFVPAGDLSNIFLALRTAVPDFDCKLGALKEEAGEVFAHQRVEIDVGGRRTVLSLTVNRINAATYMAIIEDITVLVERERLLFRAEAAALESAKRASATQHFFDRVIDLAPDPIFIKDRRHRWKLVNRAFCTFIGAPREELLGRTNAEVYSPHEAEDLDRRDEHAFLTGEPIETELTLTNRRGTPRNVIVKKTVVIDLDDEPILICTISDITEIKQAEAELRKTKAIAESAVELKSNFLAAMSHEIRSPLNGVMGFTQALLQTDLTPPQRRYAELQRDAGRGLLTVINDILDFSKLDSGKLSITPTVIDLSALVDSCAELFGCLAEAKGLSLTVTPLPPGLRWIKADGQRLRQILSNLLSNAIKFTRYGGASLAIQRVETNAGASLQIAITDTGVGIAKDKQALLFREFSQIDGSISREFGGTGLGLVITRRLTQLMGGDVDVDSEAGAGSTFTVTLPLELESAPQPVEVAATGEPDRPPSGVRILVAEDNEINRLVIEGLLGDLGYQIEFVENGAEAVAAVMRNSFDLILMDMQMPVMDGLKASRQIRNLSDRGRAIPIIALTANILPQEVALCRAAGMDDHLGKPIDLADLLSAINRALRGAYPERQHRDGRTA